MKNMKKYLLLALPALALFAGCNLDESPYTAIGKEAVFSTEEGLTAYMISKGMPDASVPMSLLADHPNVRFNYLRPTIGKCDLKI